MVSKTGRISTTVYLPPALLAWVVNEARRQGRSYTRQMEWIAQEQRAREKGGQRDG